MGAESNIQALTSNIQIEICFVGGIYLNPEFLVDYGYYIRSKYDFADEATRFFFDMAMIMYQTRTQSFTKTNVIPFMSEDNDRLIAFKKYGGWKTLENWMKLASINDFKSYFDTLKKFSLLREYERQGFNIEKIKSHKRFDTFNANDIYKLIRGKADKIKTIIIPENESEILNSHTQETILNCLEKPDQGDPYPFDEWTYMFRGARMGIMLLVGMLSNGGKSRLLCKIVAHMALVNGKNVLVLLNEMSVAEFRYALITTVINNPEFESLHGIHLEKREREITLGIYHDDKGNIVERYMNSEGRYVEQLSDYIARLNETSEEFRKIQQITKWIDEESIGKIVAKDIQSDYSEEAVRFEIKKAVLTDKIMFCAYDTLKPDKANMGDWADFKRTATVLSELAKELKINLTATFQLTDDAALLDPLEITTNQIASSKQIYHVTDEMVVFAEVKKENYGKYCYLNNNPDWGKGQCDLSPKKRYYICNTLKNRAGSKHKLLFSLDLDYNTWLCEGEVRRKSR